jgi:hypothetical protein
MDSSPPSENGRQPTPSPDISALSGSTLSTAGMVTLAVATVLTHGAALPIVVGIGACLTAAGVTVSWIPVIRKPKRRKGGKK